MNEKKPQDELRELEAARVRHANIGLDPDDIQFSIDVKNIQFDEDHIEDYRRIAIAIANPPTCKWRYDESSCSYDTGCGQKHCFIDGGPKENEHHFCPYCGHTIEAVDTDGSAHEPPEGLK